MTGLLVVTAVPAEAEAVRQGLADPTTVTVVPVGVGPAVAGAATARLLALAEAAGRPYQGVVSAGVAGGFPGRVPVGGTVLGDHSVAADLGAESPEGFLPVEELGMPAELLGAPSVLAADPTLLTRLRQRLPGATVGPVLTVSTVTGTVTSTAALVARHPTAVAEAMEGYAVAVAADQARLPFVELRTISNPIGPRDRAAWQLGTALTALTAAAAALGPTGDQAATPPGC